MRILLLVTAMALSTMAAAHEYTAGALHIGHPYAFATPPTAKTAAGYLTITNSGTVADRLLAVRTDFPEATIHAVETDAQGVTRMVPVDGLDIAPGATVTLAPKGLHVMFMGLTAPLAAGTKFPAVLVFEKAGEVPVFFVVQDRDISGGVSGGGAMDMKGMTH